MATVTRFTPRNHEASAGVEIPARESTIQVSESMYAEIENLKRQVEGTLVRNRGLLALNADLILRLERSIRKSKGRRRAVRGLEIALLRERAGK